MVKQISQKERLNTQLSDMRVNITEEDKKLFHEKHGYTSTIVSNYLNGKVASVETALKMLIFFREKIEGREKVINASDELQEMVND